MRKTLIVCHIATSSGARFSIHPTKEDLRQELVAYHNEVHVNTYDSLELAEDSDLDEVIETIENLENVSWEAIPLDPRTFWKSPKQIRICDLELNIRTVRTLGIESPATIIAEVLNDEHHLARKFLRAKDLRDLREVWAVIGKTKF